MLFPPAELIGIMNEAMAPWFRNFIGIAEWLGVVGIIVPGAIRIAPRMVAAAAAGMAFVTASASIYHFMKGEMSALPITLLIFVVAVFVAYMRWKVKPITPGTKT
jgi:hypothetical protein